MIGTIRELPTKPLAKRKLQQILTPVNDPDRNPGWICGALAPEALPQCKASTSNPAKSHLLLGCQPVQGVLV